MSHCITVVVADCGRKLIIKSWPDESCRMMVLGNKLKVRFRLVLLSQVERKAFHSPFSSGSSREKSPTVGSKHLHAALPYVDVNTCKFPIEISIEFPATDPSKLSDLAIYYPIFRHFKVKVSYVFSGVEIYEDH